MSKHQDDNASLLPAVSHALGGIAAPMIPGTLRALNRLVGAAIDIPAAWLAQKRAQIDAQTEAYRAVESAIAKAAASEAGANPEIVARAVEVLVRKSYRQQHNREAVAKTTVEELRASKTSNSNPSADHDVAEEWLDVFEQYAERASTDRMQQLWGRVLAGEIRRPGAFSLRSLRFLSEFSKADAELFANLANNVFGDGAPISLVWGEGQDLRDLLTLETAGLIHNAAGLSYRLTHQPDGRAFMEEGELMIQFFGDPNVPVQVQKFVGLTDLGKELLPLLKDRDPRAAARKVAIAMRTGACKKAGLGVVDRNQFREEEVLWDDTAVAE